MTFSKNSVFLEVEWIDLRLFAAVVNMQKPLREKPGQNDAMVNRLIEVYSLKISVHRIVA